MLVNQIPNALGQEKNVAKSGLCWYERVLLHIHFRNYTTMHNTSSESQNIFDGIDSSKWISADKTKSCAVCTKKFISPFRRKHNCRVCGDIVCRKCHENCFVQRPTTGITLVPVCVKCYAFSKPKGRTESTSSTAAASDSSLGSVEEAKVTAWWRKVNLEEISTESLREKFQQISIIESATYEPEFQTAAKLANDSTESCTTSITLLDQDDIWQIGFAGSDLTDEQKMGMKVLCTQTILNETTVCFTTGSMSYCASPLVDLNKKIIGAVMIFDTKERSEYKDVFIGSLLQNVTTIVQDLLKREATTLDQFYVSVSQPALVRQEKILRRQTVSCADTEPKPRRFRGHSHYDVLRKLSNTQEKIQQSITSNGRLYRLDAKIRNVL